MIRIRQKQNFVLVSPNVNSGEKERLDLKNIVLIGRPSVGVQICLFRLRGRWVGASVEI